MNIIIDLTSFLVIVFAFWLSFWILLLTFCSIFYSITLRPSQSPKAVIIKVVFITTKRLFSNISVVIFCKQLSFQKEKYSNNQQCFPYLKELTYRRLYTYIFCVFWSNLQGLHPLCANLELHYLIHPTPSYSSVYSSAIMVFVLNGEPAMNPAYTNLLYDKRSMFLHTKAS